MSDSSELKRILQMVESGTITADEGEALLAELMVKTCPWCAERIPDMAQVCPECQTDLRPQTVSADASAPPPLGPLNAFLVFYTFVVSGIVLFSNIMSLPGPSALCRMAVAVLGASAAILIWQRNPKGWILGILWAALQVLIIFTNNASLNKMFFFMGGSFLTNGSGFGFNLVGIILLILFIRGMKQQKGSETWL